MDSDKLKQVIDILDLKKMDYNLARFLPLMDIKTFIEYCDEISKLNRYGDIDEETVIWYARYYAFKEILQ